MASKLVGKKAAKPHPRKVKGFTVTSAPKSAARRQLLEGADLLTSGGCRTVHKTLSR
jgi:hypothetical protein